jgi:FkbM family methyltransferase
VAIIKKLRRFPEVFSCISETVVWPQVISAYVLGRKLPYPVQVRLRRGAFVQIEDRDELTTFWHVFCCGEYDVPMDSKTIVDLGANIGAFSLWAARRCPTAKIVAVEPFPSTFERLEKTVSDNNLANRVKTLNIAIGAANGVVSFDATEGKRSYCRSIIEEDSNTDSVEVPSLSLESLLDRCEIDELDCLKMDVEGGEYAIFDGASTETLRRIKVITMEYHDETSAPRLWEKLEASGFRCSRKVSGGWSGLATYLRK